MDRATLSTHLQTLGLSRTDTEMYLTALEHADGADTATVAATTELTPDEVEDASLRLADRGFVTVEFGDSEDETTISAQPLESVLETMGDALGTLESSVERDRHGSSTDTALETTDSPPFDAIGDRETVFDRIRALIDDASEEVALSIPASVLGVFEDELRAAVDRGVLVELLVGGDDELTETRFEGLSSVARVWSQEPPVLCLADYERAVLAPAEMVGLTGSTSDTPSETDLHAIQITQRQLVFVIMGSFFGNYWRIATQLYAASPDPLPQTYSNIRHAVFQATRLLETGARVRVDAEARPVGVEEFTTVSGELVDVRQSLLEPVHESFAIENALIIERERDGDEETETAEGERITLGGESAFVEEYKTRSVEFSSL